MEVDSGADSVSSTPRAKLGLEDKSVVRLMCSFGGKILPRPHDNQLRYVGGDTRIVAVSRNTTYSILLSKLSKLLSNSVDFTVKYQLPNEDLDALITVSSDEDVENMMEEFERLTFQQNSNNNGSNNRVARLRLFLFPNVSGISEGGDTPRSRTNSIASLLDGSRKRENWFLDALNGGSGGPSLERKMSEASSIVSEVPDYLFGLDNSEETATKFRNRVGLGDGVPGSDPGSPAFGSASSASQLPNLPPVKTKLENSNPNPNPNPVDVVDQQLQQPGGFVGGQVWGPGSNPGSPYPIHNPPAQNFPVYYVQAGPGQQGLVQQRNSHLQPVQVPVQVPVHGQFVQQFGQGPVQFPVGYPGSGPMYGPGEVQMQGNMVPGQGPSGLGTGQPVYYGVKNVGYPGMVVPAAGEEVVGYGPSGSDALKSRPMQP